MKGNNFSAIQLRAMEAAGLDVSLLSEKKKGLWDNIHAKRKRGEKPAKKGDKDYPETLNVEGLESARKNVGADKCWDGYKAKGTKKKGGKEVPNCVKESEKDRVIKALGGEVEEVEQLDEERTRVTQNGNIYIVGFTWLGKYMMMKLFFPEVHRPSKREVQVALEKIYPGARLQRCDQAPYNPSEPMLYMGVQEEVEQLQEKEVDVKDTRRTVDAIRAYDKSKDASRDATADSDEGKKGKAKKERAYAKKERGEIDKDDPNWKKRKYHTGMHGESVEDEKKKLN